MALINKLDNTASITYGFSTINSNTVSTLRLLPPTLLKTVDKLTANINVTLTDTVTIKRELFTASKAYISSLLALSFSC